MCTWNRKHPKVLYDQCHSNPLHAPEGKGKRNSEFLQEYPEAMIRASSFGAMSRELRARAGRVEAAQLRG